jgi:WD40 repeat protein
MAESFTQNQAIGHPEQGAPDTNTTDSRNNLEQAVERLAQDSSAEALDAVAKVLTATGQREHQEMVLEFLRSLAIRGVVTPLYELWLATRHPRLTAMLSEEGWIEDFPSHLKVFHSLESGRLSEIVHRGARVVDPLVAATRAADPEVRSRALHCLDHLANPEAVDALCARWASDRSLLLQRIIVTKNYVARQPAQARVLSALLADQAAVIVNEHADGVEALVLACADPDTLIAARAEQCVTRLANQAAIDALAELWVHRRTPELANIIEKAGYVAATPPLVRVLSALQSNKLDRLSADGPDSVFPLVIAAEDPDSVISGRARDVLDRVLEVPDARDALCRVAVEHGSALALEIARNRGFRPKDARDAALLYFLTEQWTEYEALDFDMSLLREAYERGGKKLRDSVSRRARQAGRLELVELVAGVRHKRHMGHMTIREWQVTLGILEDRHDWETMWRLAQAAPAVWSVRALTRLHAEAWLPERREQHAGFENLVRLAQRCTTDAPILGIVDRPTAQFKAHGRRVTALLISSYFESTLASASWDGTLRLWRMPDGELLHTISAHKHPVTCLAATPDASVLISGCGAERDVILWSLPEGKAIKRLHDHNKGASCLALSPDGRFLAVGCHDGLCRLWRLRDAVLVAALAGHQESVRCAAFSPDGAILATGGEDATIRLWTVPDGQPLATLEGHTMMVRSLVFSPDNQILASGGSDDDIILWSVSDRGFLKRLTGHTNMVYSLAMSGDGRVLASGGWDRTVRLWIMPEGKPWGTLEVRPGPVTCLATDPESRVLVSGSHDCSVTLWNFQSGIFRRPTTREDMERVAGLSETSVDAGERYWLAFLLAQMQWRWRHDIEIDLGPAKIEVGEFDIELM